MAPRTLIVTLPPFEGGVPAKTRILAGELARRGHRVTIAYYAPLSSHGYLCAPCWTLRKPRAEAGRCFDGEFAAMAVGCRWPELEFSYYRPSVLWDGLIAAHDRHVAVGGTVLASNVLVRAGTPHLTWCASDMLGDRLARREAMKWPRRLFDTMVIGRVQAEMERRILAGPGRIVTVGFHARKMLQALCPARTEWGGMPIPTDPATFAPPAKPAPAGIIGFSGRLNDPRKNVLLLAEAVRLARRQDPRLQLRLTGRPGPDLARTLHALGADEFVEWTGVLDRADLPAFYQSLDVFAIPSTQEGFGIVGIEAMASGVPVVSTRCGGPEDYVLEGRTGFLVDHDAQELANRLLHLTQDRELRTRLSAGALSLARTEYGPRRFAAALEENWRAVWGENP